MDESIEEIMTAELGPGEGLHWTGRPRQGYVLRAGDTFLIPFSLFWGGFAVFAAITAMMKGPIFQVLFLIPFVLIGLYITLGRFWVDSRQRAKTYYAVTSERVIIISGLFSRRIKSLSIDTITDASLTERRNGSGMITFGPVPPYFWMYNGTGFSGRGPEVPNFDLDTDARHVYEIILGAQRAAKKQAMKDE